MNRRIYKRKTPRSKKKGPVQSKKISYDGINFASGLEKYMYMCLKNAGIKAEYEGEKFILFEGFEFTSSVFERQANGKGEYKERGFKKILPITYKPDFIGDGFIIETKGRANDAFPLRWKMFKSWIEKNRPGTTLYKPQTKAEVDITISLILKSKNG